MPRMDRDDLQAQCELGQSQLMRMEYLEAERTLSQAESRAWHLKDFDTLARLYMPLQEARRQRRQRCAEGMVCLDLLAQSPQDHLDGRHVAENYPTGQLLVAGWGSLAPALVVRRLAFDCQLYLETFLAAVYPITGGGRAAVLAPLANVNLPSPCEMSIADLRTSIPPGCILLEEHEIPAGSRPGNAQTYATVMQWWERLHLPFLARADRIEDPIERMEGYRLAIAVDYACELAHQNLSAVASGLSRGAAMTSS